MLPNVRYEVIKRFSSPLFIWDLIFDVALVAGTGIWMWIWVQDPIAKLSAEFALLMSNGAAIYFYHRNIKDRRLQSYALWCFALLVSTVLAAVFIRLEPIWWQFFVTFMNGDQNTALDLLNSHAHGNIPMVIGLFGVYVSLVGILRLTLDRVLKLFLRLSR